MPAKYKAQKSLDPIWIRQYWRHRDILWDEIVGLSTSLYLLERIIAFDFQLFQPKAQNIFWHTTANSLYESCVLSVWRIAVDSGADLLTLSKFKAQTLVHITNPEAKKSVLRKLKRVDFEKSIESVQGQIRKLRHSRYGHLKPVLPILVEVRDLRAIAANCLRLLNALSFEVVLHALPPAYLEWPSDVDLILGAIVCHSGILDMPEKEPAKWKEVADALTKYSRSLLNWCRRQHGLAEIGDSTANATSDDQ